MKKKKGGATLITVVIIFMFISVVLVAFLSMISSNYVARISESKRIQNLYGSESELDTAYNVMAKTIEAANRKGYEDIRILKNEVKELMEKESDENPYQKFESIKDENQKILYALYSDIDYWKYYNGNIKGNEQKKDEKYIREQIKKDEEDIDKFINIVFKESFKGFINQNLKRYVEDGVYIQVKTDENNKIIYDESDRVAYGSTTMVYLGEKPSEDKKIINKSQENNLLLATNGDNLDNNIDENEENIIDWLDNGNNVNIESRTLYIENGYDNEGIIKYEKKNILKDSNEEKFKYNLDEEAYIKVTSEFKTDSAKENTVKVGENKRTIQAEYSIKVPNYDEVAFKESVVNSYELKEIPGLTIGGNMEANGAKKLNIIGDIFVEGDESTNIINNKNRTYEKYEGGIKLNNDSINKTTINFNDNVFTRGTFNLKSNVDVTIKGDLYARNIYAGNENNLSDNSKLTINKEAVIDNDLSVKASNTHITIQDFYGISDKNFDKDKKFRKSSSIIINDYKSNKANPSSVKINGKAYIMGVAHINTEDGYQTGESVAIKGNYKAYSVPIDGNEKFKYDNPLQVLDEDDVFAKSKHFYNYWKDKLSGDKSIDCGGVILPKDNTYSVGAIVYYDEQGAKKVVDSNYNENIEIEAKKKRLNYARNVYKLQKDTDKISDQDAEKLYTSREEKAEKVSDKLEKLLLLEDSEYNLKNMINTGRKMAIFCPEQKTIVIKGDSNTDNTKKYGDNVMIIDATSNKEVKAVIVTKGNVIIDGKVDFRGNIIAEGDLKIEKGSNVNIYYDENITKDIQNSNGALFNKVFGKEFGGQELQNQEQKEIQSNSSMFLRSKMWKIIK